jgi:DNA-binding transcriptional MocR family regulator
MDSRVSARALAVALGGWRTREPAYEALADGIRLLCLDNRLAPRTALPAERELAAALSLSRSTVAAAYRSLRDSGHIASLRGSGSVTLPLGRREPGRILPGEGAIDLQQASPPAWPGLAGVLSDVAQTSSRIVARTGYDVVGRVELREAIARRYSERGVPTTPNEILVTTGAQSAIHLVSSVLLGRGDRVLIETPTYPHAADAFRRVDARLVGVPVSTDDGWDLDRAEQAFARTLPVVAYLMPDFQNPTGRSMSAQERATIAKAAERAGTILVLDETTADLDIDAPERAPGFIDGDPDTVVRIGSLGKTVWGGLRVGWIRAEADLVRRLVAARPAHELGTPGLRAGRGGRGVPAVRGGGRAAVAASARRQAGARHRDRGCASCLARAARPGWGVALDRIGRTAQLGTRDGRALARPASDRGSAVLGGRRS